MTWTFHVVLTLLTGFCAVVIVNRYSPSSVRGQRMSEYSEAIRTSGSACPSAVSVEKQTDGPANHKVTCNNGAAYGFSWVAGGAGYRVVPW